MQTQLGSVERENRDLRKLVQEMKQKTDKISNTMKDIERWKKHLKIK